MEAPSLLHHMSKFNLFPFPSLSLDTESNTFVVSVAVASLKSKAHNFSKSERTESGRLELVHPLLSANYHLQLKLMYLDEEWSGLGMGTEKGPQPL